MPLTVDLIREIHRRVEDGLIPTAGSFRDQDVNITGAASPPPHWADVMALVLEMCSRYESVDALNPVVLTAWLHGTFTRIHPFMDGNGRVGRLLQDFTLISSGLFPVGIPVARRGEYYDALESADTGDWRPLIEVIANSELTALDRARRIAEAPARRRARVRELLRAAQATTRQRDYNRYEVWRRRVVGARDEFVRWVEEFNAEAEALTVRVRTYDPISFDKWNEMRMRGRGVRNTWILTLTFSVERRPVYTFLFYARRHEFGYAHDMERLERGLVGIFLTGADEPDARYEFGRYSDPYVAPRELLYVDGRRLVYRDPTVFEKAEGLPDRVEASLERERWRCDEDATLADVVRNSSRTRFASSD